MFRSQSYYRMMRSLEEALAYRKDGVIYVLISGELSTQCDEAKVVDKYPGTRTYVMDPGHDTVTIYVNGEAFKRISIEEKSSSNCSCESSKMH